MCCQQIHPRKKTTSSRTNWPPLNSVSSKAAFELLGLISEGPGYLPIAILLLLAIFLHDIYFDILIILSFENEAISAVYVASGFYALRTI